MINRNLKILQLGKFYPVRGGVEKVMFDLMVGLSEQEVDCDMLCAAGEGESLEQVMNAHARLMVCPAWAKVAATMIAPAMVLKLRRIVSKYDVVHVHHPDPMAALALWCAGFKGKVVLHWHSDIQKQKILLKFYKPLQEWLIRRADVIVGTTPVYLAESPCLKGVQEKTICLPIGIEPVVYQEEQAEQIRRKYAGRKIVFSLGRLVHYKGFRYLVEAAQYLGDEYVVLIGGTGALREELQNQIAALGVSDKVELLGRVSEEELPAYYGACKLFCLSSVQKTEAFGIVQIEAMSCGKPVVATRIPQSGVSWVNKHGYSGLNVEPDNALQLAEAIKAIADNEEQYRIYAEQAKRRFEKWFTKERMITECINIYNKVCNNERV